MTKTFDLEEFKLFVAGKPASETYCSLDARCCALGQFGIPNVQYDKLRGVPRAVLLTALESPCTFGALLSRLNNLPAESPTADEGGGSVPLTPALTNDGGEE